MDSREWHGMTWHWKSNTYKKLITSLEVFDSVHANEIQAQDRISTGSFNISLAIIFSGFDLISSSSSYSASCSHNMLFVSSILNFYRRD